MPVDIFEDSEGITLMADMPGVSREHLDIEVHKDMLLVEGDARIDMPEGMEAVHADVRSTRYRRSFALSSELDVEKLMPAWRMVCLTCASPNDLKFGRVKLKFAWSHHL